MIFTTSFGYKVWMRVSILYVNSGKNIPISDRIAVRTAIIKDVILGRLIDCWSGNFICVVFDMTPPVVRNTSIFSAEKYLLIYFGIYPGFPDSISKSIPLSIQLLTFVVDLSNYMMLHKIIWSLFITLDEFGLCHISGCF